MTFVVAGIKDGYKEIGRLAKPLLDAGAIDPHHRKAAADPFGKRHNVGRHTAGLMRKEMARPPHAALDFIENQQETMFVTKRTQPP
mgnify:CR=1 FL=1